MDADLAASNGVNDVARLISLVDELSDENRALREQFAALNALFELRQTTAEAVAAEAAARTPAAHAPPAAAAAVSPQMTEVVSDVRSSAADGATNWSHDKHHPLAPGHAFEERLVEAAASQRHREERQSTLAEELASLRTDLALLRGERDGLLRSAVAQNEKLEKLSTELVGWKQYATQVQQEAAAHADAARTARAETTALRTLLIARYPFGQHLLMDGPPALSSASGVPTTAGAVWPPEAEALARFTATALGRDRSARGVAPPQQQQQQSPQ